MMKDTEYMMDAEIGKNMDYQTAAELEKLIAEVEQTDLTPAPPDLQEMIFERLDLEEQRKRDKIIEYKRYRFRVLTTVAAAVAVVLLLPKFEFQQPQDEFFKTFLTQEFILDMRREAEVTGLDVRYEAKEEESDDRYQAKDEALDGREIMDAIKGGVNIFANNNRWNLFKE